MKFGTAATSERALGDWLRRNDWVLYEAATQTVEDEDAFAEGLEEVTMSQLQAVLNTVRMCSSASDFEGFIKKRKDRRQRDARQGNKEYLKLRAEFWSAFKEHVQEVQDNYAAPATEETSVPESKKELAQMRVLRAYFEHFISHCVAER